MSGTSINGERSGWKAALWERIWRCWLKQAQYYSAMCPGSQQSKLDNTAWSVGQQRWLSQCILHWCILTLSTMRNYGPHNLRGMWISLNVSRGGQQRCKVWKTCPVRSGWGRWAFLVWRKWGWGATSQCLRGFWTMPLTTCLTFWSVLSLSGSWTRWSL